MAQARRAIEEASFGRFMAGRLDAWSAGPE
jgi:hypothetical protein